MNRDTKVFLLNLLTGAGLVAAIQFLMPRADRFPNLFACASIVFVMAAGGTVIDRAVERGQRIPIRLATVFAASLIIWIVAALLDRNIPGHVAGSWSDGGVMILVVLAADFFVALYHRQRNLSKMAKEPAST